MRTLPLELPATTFSTLREVESNSSAVASLLVSAITDGVFAFTWISDGVNLWFCNVTGIGCVRA